METIFVPDPAGMKYLVSWEGPVGRDSSRRLRTLEYRAKMSAGVGTPTPTRMTPGGALRMSIKTIKEPATETQLEARVGSNRPYALWHHEGTGIYGGKGPYLIKPKKPGGRLRFWWARTGTIEYRKSVVHPGSKPNPYLTRWLREAVR